MSSTPSPYSAVRPSAATAVPLARQGRRSKFHWPFGSASEGMFEVVVTPQSAGWAYCGLRLLTLAPGQSARFATGTSELIVLPLEGACTVTTEGRTFPLEGRRSVFERVTDFAYVPRDSEVEVRSERGGRFAFPSALADKKLEPRYGPAEGVVIETRGAGRSTRQVNNFCSPATFPFADKLIGVEVLTPAGNWSSYPPHKHDEHRVDEAGEVAETQLEEIYAFVLPGRELGIQRAYSSGPGREIDVCVEVGDGDVVLIPHGWHGPSIAPPHTDLYYLNVMAGPAAGRAWKICFDLDRAGVMDAWKNEPPDPRVPLTTAAGRRAAPPPHG